MGWSTIRERVAKAKLVFQKKIENLEEERWAKQILLEEQQAPNWNREINRWKRKENVEREWERLGLKDVNKRVKENGLNRWRTGMNNKSTLKWYKSKKQPEKINWHKGDRESKLMFKARAGVLEVNGRKRDEAEQGCRHCGEEKETIEHFIVECDKYEEERQELIDSIKEEIGEEEWDRRLWEEEEGGIVTALGLYEKSQTNESIIKHMKAFLNKCWTKREQ